MASTWPELHSGTNFNYVWDTVGLEWVKETQAGGSGGSGGDGAILDGVSSAIKATVLDLLNANPLTVAIVDASGNQISSFGGGTQYAEDTASVGAEILTMAGVVRKDTAASLVDTDADRTELIVDDTGRLWVHQRDLNFTFDSVVARLSDASGSPVLFENGPATDIEFGIPVHTSTNIADGTAYSVASALWPIGAVYHDSLTELTSGDFAILRASAARGLHVNLRDESGTELGPDSNGNWPVVFSGQAADDLSTLSVLHQMLSELQAIHWQLALAGDHYVDPSLHHDSIQ